jgi:futalosine hydrolase
MTSAAQTLVLVPTKIERQYLATQTGFGVQSPTELCGFGPVAAAARASRWIAHHQPARVILTGIAGTLDPTELPVGTAVTFSRVAMHGIGVGVTADFVSAATLGFPHWPGSGASDPAHLDELILESPVTYVASQLLTCCTASQSPTEARERRERYPDAIAEDMEGFAVALACRLAGIPLAIVRGISNEVGDRRVARWQIPAALDAAWRIVTDLLGRPIWDAVR